MHTAQQLLGLLLHFTLNDNAYGVAGKIFHPFLCRIPDFISRQVNSCSYIHVACIFFFFNTLYRVLSVKFLLNTNILYTRQTGTKEDRNLDGISLLSFCLNHFSVRFRACLLFFDCNLHRFSSFRR